MPFLFQWCCEAVDGGDDLCGLSDSDELNGYIQWETSDIIKPTHINISNLLDEKTITINPIAVASQADKDNYHFKLVFNVGFLADLDNIELENNENWSIYCERDSLTDSLYLLWKGEAKILNTDDTIEVIITGLAAKFGVTRTNTTEVTIDWQFKQGNLDIIDIQRSEGPPPTGGDYADNINLTLEIMTTTGKSNIPLYVGFVGSNKVLNTHDETSDLKLRVTNISDIGSANSDITFVRNNADDSFSSQLEVELEVGNVTDVPWALGDEDDINGIAITVETLKPPEEEEEEENSWGAIGSVEFIPQVGSAKVLRWTFVPPSAGFVLGAKETLLINLSGIVTAHPTGETNLYLRYSNVPGYQNGQFICQIEKAPLVFEGTDQKAVRIDTSLSFHEHQGQKVYLYNHQYGSGIQNSTTYFRTAEHFGWYRNGYHDDGILNPGGGEVRMALNEHKLGIGTNNPVAKLHVSDGNGVAGNAVIDGNLGIGTDSPSSKLHVHGGDAQFDGKVGIGTDTPSKKLDVRGDVSIGTSSPSAKLEVISGNARIVQNDTNATLSLERGDNFLKMKAQDPISRITFSKALLFHKGDNGDTQLKINGDNGRVGIGTGDPSAKLDVNGDAVIDGNLGIGTSYPSAKLDVRGEIRGKLWYSDQYYVQATNESASTKMLHKDQCFAFITSVSGAFNGGGEAVWVAIGDDGYWYLKAKAAGGNTVYGYARCVGMP